MSDTIHASAALVGGKGVLIRGKSGSGKSSLLLALLSSRDVDATLIADDRVQVEASRSQVLASAPATIAGQLEIRGIGIVRKPHVSSAPIDLVVDLLPLAECPRLPSGDEACATVAGVAVPRIFIAVGANDGVARVKAALARSAVEINA